MVDLKMNRQRKSKRKDDNSVSEFYILFFILIKCALQLSVEGHKSIV